MTSDVVDSHVEEGSAPQVDENQSMSEKDLDDLVLSAGFSLYIGDKDVAVKQWRKAAALGSTTAMCSLGVCYRMGVKGVVEEDMEQAKGFYERSVALGGDTQGMNDLSLIYLQNGEGPDRLKGVVLSHLSSFFGYDGPESSMSAIPEELRDRQARLVRKFLKNFLIEHGFFADLLAGRLPFSPDLQASISPSGPKPEWKSL